MTRKDYIAIAAGLSDALNCVPQDYSNRYGVLAAASSIAGYLQKDNPRFDREHFLAVVRGERELTSRPPRQEQ